MTCLRYLTGGEFSNFEIYQKTRTSRKKDKSKTEIVIIVRTPSTKKKDKIETADWFCGPQVWSHILSMQTLLIGTQS